jgi:hypothetical protein
MINFALEKTGKTNCFMMKKVMNELIVLKLRKYKDISDMT